MNKSGIVYRHIAEKCLINRMQHFVVRGIARELGISPDTVSNALAPLKRTGSVFFYRGYFQVENFKKLLIHWAVNREFERDIAYSTFVAARSADDIENRLPDGIAFTCFSGYVKTFSKGAADYSEVYAYANGDSLDEIKKRFPPATRNGIPGAGNLIILKPDQELEKLISSHRLQHSSAPISQIYVDIWNNNTWNAYEFLKRFDEKLDDIYAKAILEH